MLVALPAVLLASEIATRVVTQAFNGVVEQWLRETTEYVIASMRESEEELEGAFALVQQRFTKRKINFSLEETAAMRTLGIEGLLVRDASGEVMFSTGNIRTFDAPVLYPGGMLRWITTDEGEHRLAFVLEKIVDSPDGERQVSMADLIGLDPYSVDKGHSSLVLRIFTAANGGFEQVFASDGGRFAVPADIGRLLQAGVADIFVPDSDWSGEEKPAHLFYKPMYGEAGELRAVLVSGVSMSGLDRLAANTSFMFWALFGSGVLVSGVIGLVLARRIARPIRSLEAGVQRIASGEFGYEVPVVGSDEVAGLSRDFNTMSRQLEVMQREKEQAANRERASILGEIALGFAHEIRNPLLVIKTSAEVLHNRLTMSAQDTRLLGFVVEEVERINALLSEFLGYAKPAVPVMAPASLAGLADVALTLCQARLEQRGVTGSLTRELQDDTVLCDANQIQQVLLNLILNAIDAMPDGGELRLRVYGHGEQVCLDVADTGRGMSAELLRTIHLPFVSTKEKGLGLGLAKAYAIIEGHGGSIVCASEEGRGTTFTIRMRRRAC